MSSGKWRPFCLGLNVLSSMLFYVAGVLLGWQKTFYQPKWNELRADEAFLKYGVDFNTYRTLLICMIYNT